METRSTHRSLMSTAIPIALLLGGCASQPGGSNTDAEHQTIAGRPTPFHVAVMPTSLSADGHSAMELLAETCAFMDPDEPGAHSVETLAFARLLDEPDAMHTFDNLQEYGSAAGRVWGLLGLARVAPDVLHERLPNHRHVADMVFLPTGPTSVASIVEDRWPRLVQLRQACAD